MCGRPPGFTVARRATIAAANRRRASFGSRFSCPPLTDLRIARQTSHPGGSATVPGRPGSAAVGSNAVMPSLPLLAGRYRLESQIAAGGVGEVWRGEDTLLTRPVAIKLLRAEYAAQPETLVRFRAEARHAGALSHPAICRVFDYGDPVPPNPAFLVMELVNGLSLAAILIIGPLGAAQTMDVVAQVASGLYSLGVVAYECLAGTAPFTGKPLEVAAAHRDLPLPPFPYAVPAEVAQLVAELTAKDPAARPASAREVATRAGRLREGMTGGVDGAAASWQYHVPSTVADLLAPGPPPRRYPRSAGGPRGPGAPGLAG